MLSNTSFPQNGYAPPFPPHQKNFLLFWKFFSKKLFNENIQNLILYKTGYTDFFVVRCPLPLKMVMPSHKSFFVVFSENTTFFEKFIWNKKVYINFMRKTPPFPKKWSNASPKQFFAFFPENTAFSKKNCSTWKYLASNL